MTLVLLYLFLPSSFYLKSDGVSYEQQEFLFLLIGVDIDIHKMKFLFVSTLHLGKPAGYIVTTFYKYVFQIYCKCDGLRVGE